MKRDRKKEVKEYLESQENEDREKRKIPKSTENEMNIFIDTEEE